MKIIMFSIAFFVFSAFLAAQDGFHMYFEQFEDKMDNEYQKVYDKSKSEDLIKENDLEYIYSAVEAYKNNSLLFEIIIEDGVSHCSDDFELKYFAFYSYEYPAYTWAYCIYKHKKLGFYKGVNFDVSDYNGNGLNNRITSCKYFEKFPAKLNWETKSKDYEYAKTLNLIGFNLLFKEYDIDRIKLMLSIKDLTEVNRLSAPY